MPTPNVSILASGGVLYAQVGSSVELACSISINPAIADIVTVSVTWLRGTTPLSNTTDGVSISFDADSWPVYISVLTVYLVTDPADSDNFTCRARLVPDIQSQLIMASDSAEETVIVVIEGKSEQLAHLSDY